MPDPNAPADVMAQVAPPQLTTAGGLNPTPMVPPAGQPFLADPVLPIATAGADQPQLFPSSVDVHPLIAAVVPAIHASVPPENWAMTAATVLQALSPLQDQVFAASRASSKTQMKVNLAEVGVVTLAGILQMFFPHPRAG